MKTLFTVATVLALATGVPTLSDFGAVRASHARHLFLAEAGTTSPGGRTTALLAEASGPSPSGHDTALA